MRLAIADPPYPPYVGIGGRKNRASRWYGDGQRSDTDRPADHHDQAAIWDDPATHRQLIERLADEYDGWAIATAPDGIDVYRPLPVAARLMVWVKPNATPTAHRIRGHWEAIILYPPEGRRSSRTPRGSVPDVLTASAPRDFIGAKPPQWTHWVLAAMSYDPDTDTVTDLFSGSGAVKAAAAQHPLIEAWP